MIPPLSEKGTKFAWIFKQNQSPMIHWGFRVLMFGVLLALLLVWGIDSVSVTTFQTYVVGLKPSKTHSDSQVAISHQDLSFTNYASSPTQPPLPILHDPMSLKGLPSKWNKSKSDSMQSYPFGLPMPQQNLGQPHVSISPEVAPEQENLPKIGSVSNENVGEVRVKMESLEWVSAKFEANYTTHLMADWLAPGGEPCKDSKSVNISVPELDTKKNIILSAGEIHEFVFQAVDDQGSFRCSGGDYFETDISGESWKSRPPIKDFGNGTYSFSLQVHQDFAGDYNFTIILLFRLFEGLKISTEKHAFDKVLRVIPIKFKRTSAQLPMIKECKKGDFVKDVWSGRWTRHAKNGSCEISDDGRFRCQEPNFPCQHPWCDGSLGLLESNGWVYSTQCSFKIFNSDEAWNCLSGRWIFWWGDSNHCDTIRNILNFVLGIGNVPVVPRIYDSNVTNPKNPSQVVRFTSIFNGHWNSSSNYQGLNSLSNADYRKLLKGYFSGNVVPDTIIMNSGLHDGIYWPNLRRFVGGADFTAKFWKEVFDSMRERGVVPPVVIYRTTITTGGYARRLAFNPSKMEAFNGVVLDKLRQYGVVEKVIDDFDLTYPWHYDNRCNDGVHYGRAPAKMKWRDGQIGHQYFVDLMLCHVLFNALCSR
ncbi:oxygenase [Lithospermum erythrorhizon]|uniref:Oxygenase n=1 Tax=Lithospermum erythrorhizon TaxID=34254 RepID=A0AAV3QW10_LITER